MIQPDRNGMQTDIWDVWDVDRLAIDNADSYEELVSQLYMIRNYRGLTTHKVEEALKLRTAGIAGLESGHGNPTIGTLQDYAEVLGAYLALIAVPAHRAGEWRDRARQMTESLQKKQVEKVYGKAIATKVMYPVGWRTAAGA